VVVCNYVTVTLANLNRFVVGCTVFMIVIRLNWFLNVEYTALCLLLFLFNKLILLTNNISVQQYVSITNIGK